MIQRLPYKLLIRYLIAGITGLIINVGVLYVFKEFFHIWYLYASIIAFVIATCASFVLQKFWTFQNHTLENVHGQFFIFILIATINVFLNTGLLFLLVSFGHIWYLGGQVISSGLVAFESLVVYKYVIFNS